MKILVLPTNTASMPSILIEALNQIESVEAKGFFIGSHKYHYKGAKNIFLEPYPKSKIFKWMRFHLCQMYSIITMIFWADAVYFVSNNSLKYDLDLKLLNFLNKPRLVEWLGSEIRNPEIAKEINPYIETAYANGYEYLETESAENSYNIQLKFHQYGFIPIAMSEMDLYINKLLFQKRYVTFQRINIGNFKPNYPLLTNQKPVILHSPTAPICKGTNYIIPVIEDLKKDYNFEFIILQNLSRDEVLEQMSNCDIFLDQIILGSHGTAATEALAFGKPVMCYLMPAVFDNGFPRDTPIVNTNVNNLKEQLIKLITDPVLRNEIGKKSRAYAEKYHDANVVAKKVYNIFQEIQKKTKE